MLPVGIAAASQSGALQDLSFNPNKPNDFGARRIALKMVSVITGEPVDVVELGLNPDSYQRTFELRTRIHPTAAGFMQDRLRDARGLGHFVYSGTTGHWPKGRPVGTSDRRPDGMAELRSLQRLLDTVNGPEINGEPPNLYQLILVDPFAPVSSRDAAGNSTFIVVPERTGLDLHMSGDRATIIGYTLRLAALAPVEGDKRKLDTKDRERSFLQQIQDAIFEVQRYSFDNMFSRYRRLIGPILRARAMIADIGQFLKNWSTGIDGLLNFHVSLMEGFRDALRSVRDGLYSLLPFIDPEGVEPSPGAAVSTDEREDPATADRVQTVQLLAAVERVLNGALANPGVLGPRLAEPSAIGGQAGVPGLPSPTRINNNRRRLRPLDQTARRPWLANSPALASRMIPVGAGDTFERLVPPGFTDLDVVSLNPSLRYPFVDGNRERNGSDATDLAFVGDLIRVPATVGGPNATARGASPGASQALAPDETEAERIFGCDLRVDDVTFSRLTPDGSQVTDTAPGLIRRGGDLEIVRGDDNLTQRLRHALAIRRGALGYADIGLDFEGTHFSSPMQLQIAAASVRNTVQSDPGIREVTRVSGRAEDGLLVIVVEAESVTGSPVGPLATTI
jgi:hypothetical protein